MSNLRRRGLTQGGFTLMELLIVIAIILILLGMLVPASFMAIRKAKETKTRALIQRLETALSVYNNDWGDYPSALDVGGSPQANIDMVSGLTDSRKGGPYIELEGKERVSAGAPGTWLVVDPWKRPLHYYHYSTYDPAWSQARKDERTYSFQIYSEGYTDSDGDGTNDDLAVNPTTSKGLDDVANFSY